jgi:putative membrane protein
MMVGFWGIVLWAVAALARGTGNERALPPRREPTALEILERRYARGELSDEEFDARRRMLLGGERSSSAQHLNPLATERPPQE